MSILVTGGAGYIGSHVILALRDKEQRVVALDDLSTGFRSAIPPDVPLVVGDIADSALLEKTISYHGIKSIMHFAAKTIVPDSVSKPLEYYLSNTVKTRSLLTNAVAQGVEHFIFSSTAAVYGEPGHIPVHETDYPAPINPYGRSKLMSEWMVQDAAGAHGFRYVVLRYFNVAGADPHLRSGQSTANATHLIKRAVQTALGRYPRLDIFGSNYPTRDGTCIRDYIHVSDLASAHLDALEYLRVGGASETFNCGYGTGYSVLEIVQMVKEVSGIDFEIRLAPRRDGDAAAVVAACDNAKEKLKWTPRHNTLKEIVSHALAWEERLQSISANHASK